MKTLLKGTLMVASVLALAACSNGQETVATSKAGNITQQEFYTALKTSSGNSVLQQLVLRKVLEGDTSDAKALLESTKEDVKKQVEQYGGEDAFKQAIANSGFQSIEAYEDTVYLNKLIEASVKKHVSFTDEEIQQAYDNYQPKIQASHILIPIENGDENAAKEKAEELIQQLKDGADFAELAKENSSDKGSAEQGGDLGEFDQKQMVPEFTEAAFALANVGDITETPVKTQFGYHIIKLTKKDAKGTFEEMKDVVKEDLLKDKMRDSALIQKTIADVVKEADVKITDATLSNAINNLTKEVNNTEN